MDLTYDCLLKVKFREIIHLTHLYLHNLCLIVCLCVCLSTTSPFGGAKGHQVGVGGPHPDQDFAAKGQQELSF